MNEDQQAEFFQGVMRRQMSIRIGRPMLESLDAVQKWADANGGELAVRQALHEGKFDDIAGTTRLAHAWIAEQERQRVEQRATETLETDRRAAAAAERAARYAMWSAIISTVSTIVAALAYLLSRT